MAVIKLLICCLLLPAGCSLISSETDPGDAAVLCYLREHWHNTPASWSESDDPCGGSWEGVTCINSRVTGLYLSFNKELSGSIIPQIGALQNLETLVLEECSFTGTLPAELGNLEELSFLSLNGNNFTGEIPPSLGNLSKLTWLNLADNRLTGSIPVSTYRIPGLDLLHNLKHLVLSGNQLSGPIPQKLFSSNMVFNKILLSGNQLSGGIPFTIGLVQTLQTLFLGENSLAGKIPSNINNLTNLIALDMPNNKLSGPLPNLSGMNSLLRVELSNNSFEVSEAPAWFSTLPSLNILNIDNGPLCGLLPPTLFSLPDLAVVSLRNNAFNGTLLIGSNINQNILSVDLENNGISSISIDPVFKSKLNLIGNPICNSAYMKKTSVFCQVQKQSANP
ncbi:unnamed protein product [Coffea canephora]|uniref:non-specific serine/threonine protein kinase n=1 Tax=Coffea canephora TaxID=49390 RepID=A0A068UVU7_COFCA|nr:unnamed protein product [Coffea canephora]